MTEEQPKLTKSDVKARGWTEGSIKNFLGMPDAEKTNPRGGSSPKIKLYDLSRVVAAEQSSAFIAWQQKTKATREKQRQRALAKAEKQRRALCEYINGLDIEIEKFANRRQLYKAAVEHYNNLQIVRGGDGWASTKDDLDFLKRISVNMLRHSEPHYEAELERLFGVVGRAEGYSQLKEKINGEIYRMYPYLATEDSQEESGLPLYKETQAADVDLSEE